MASLLLRSFLHPLHHKKVTFMASVKTSHTKIIDRNLAASFDVKGLLYLYHIHLTDGREVRLFPGQKTSQIIQFGGHKYRAHPIETDGFSWQIDDRVHQPYLRLARQDLALDLSPHDDVFRGGTVERLMTFLPLNVPRLSVQMAVPVFRQRRGKETDWLSLMRP